MSVTLSKIRDIKVFFQKSNLKYIVFPGHSLGAHIAGAAGRQLHRSTKKLVPRITGLDPASKS